MNYRRATFQQLLTLALTLATTGSAAYSHQVSMPSMAAVGAATLSPVKLAEQQLRTMGEPIHRAKRAAADLVRECTRENTVMAGGEIDFIGTDVIPILPDTAEGLGTPTYFPPRKQYLDMHMAQLQALMPILQGDITATKSPDPAQSADTAAAVTEMNQYFTDAGTHLDKLKTLTGTQPYNADAIVAEAQALHQDIVSIDKIRKKVYDAIKRDPNDKKIDQDATQQQSK